MMLLQKDLGLRCNKSTTFLKLILGLNYIFCYFSPQILFYSSICFTTLTPLVFHSIILIGIMQEEKYKIFNIKIRKYYSYFSKNNHFAINQ